MRKKYLAGLDVGSSSVKVSLVDASSGRCAATTFYPKSEAPIVSVRKGWAEQDPQIWWDNMRLGLRQVMTQTGAAADDIAAIGISYQMHGLVCVDRELKPLRPAIIWCDSRAVTYGERAMRCLGRELCLTRLLNSPGNFTAAKLAWVKDNEPDIYERIYKVMLPGDYIAMRLSGTPATTVSGLSEGMLWDFSENSIATFLMDYYGFDTSLIADIVPTFGLQGEVSTQAANELGLKAGTPITYRAGDQPNNALSLNVLEPGQIAATAGTSGVVYGVLGQLNYDPRSRVNMFAHVNHQAAQPRLGTLLCINGTGILNAWMRHNITPALSYAEMNNQAAQVPIGSDGVCILPFGNGAERLLENREPGCSIHGLDFNKHTAAHLLRAAQEGIVFAFCMGMDIMRQMGMDIRTIHAGHANMFLSPLLRHTLATVSGATIELYDTDGSVGAARGAGIGAGIYASNKEAFASLHRLMVVEPDQTHNNQYQEAYDKWKIMLRSENRKLTPNT
ncbi:MAG: carbohydrate kinase [Prevotella sp.]|nr:carbohydrate kinase [Prevotella sp.]